MHYKKTILRLLLTLLALPLNAQNTATNLLQNIGARDSQTLNGRWQIIVDPLENGYYNHRYQPRDDGYFKNAKMQKPTDLIEYDFDTDEELMVPGD